ncbi:2-oxo-4-hydroxy-4-carboxy-5-ureidoimidazoline decarboxylase [Peterkaempfera griseoplana]|uniref:2-oxo-4-hydroxy-4-carboxy-5-ureidoimidazoline decarboxylase n=1 Tax=Peterkaempfera griseoplana TaxID=66896 RepID=UPI0006E15D87|nr:2-oxo-4-hydroxy-4-carboxy-5-ureidoimidazoline decarboxylase [Peterkaempfera griseoplana]
MPYRPPTALDRLNSAPAAELDALLREVCASGGWASAVAATRPWPDAAALLAAADAAVARLDEAGLREALAGHARIGTPREGDAVSQREQSGVRGAGAEVLDQLREANAAYEARFGHLFLICATGRTAESMLAALHERCGHDPAAERETVRGELAKINAIRLRRLLEEAP